MKKKSTYLTKEQQDHLETNYEILKMVSGIFAFFAVFTTMAGLIAWAASEFIGVLWFGLGVSGLHGVISAGAFIGSRICDYKLMKFEENYPNANKEYTGQNILEEFTIGQSMDIKDPIKDYEKFKAVNQRKKESLDNDRNNQNTEILFETDEEDEKFSNRYCDYARAYMKANPKANPINLMDLFINNAPIDKSGKLSNAKLIAMAKAEKESQSTTEKEATE